MREKTLDLRLKFSKIGETVVIILKRLRFLSLLITRILSLVLECNHNEININNTKDVYNIYILLKQQNWKAIISISRLEMRLFDISCAELMLASLSKYFPYFQCLFLDSIYDALYWLTDPTINWYDPFENKTYCTLTTRYYHHYHHHHHH